MNLNPDYGGSLPPMLAETAAKLKSQTRKEEIFEIISLRKTEGLTDTQIVIYLIRNIIVLTGSAGWHWLKRYYEQIDNN